MGWDWRCLLDGMGCLREILERYSENTRKTLKRQSRLPTHQPLQNDIEKSYGQCKRNKIYIKGIRINDLIQVNHPPLLALSFAPALVEVDR